MKRIFRRLSRRLPAWMALLVLFILFILNPQILYAKKRQYHNVTIYSAKPCFSEFNNVIGSATDLIQKSAMYHSSFKFDVFVKDGLSFPHVLKKILGDAFKWGYHNHVVLAEKNDESLQFINLNYHQRQLARTIAYEMIHCLQANRFGIFNIRPVKNIPNCKWEGYSEYIGYHSSLHKEGSLLLKNLLLPDSLKKETYYPVEIDIDEGKSFAGLDYFHWWLMVKYCFDIKGMSFSEIIKNNVQYHAVYNEMMNWYCRNYKARCR